MCPSCVSRRDFVRVAAAIPVMPSLLRLREPVRADWLLIPMDDVQAEHLKAYGLTFRAIQRGVKAEWLLNYRGGSFLLPGDALSARDAALNGITVEGLSDATVTQIRGEIATSNMDAVPLEKAPKVAVYVPPFAAPWDDAVTMALNYAGIEYDKLWDVEVVDGGLKTYDWLHLHHEDFTGQYSKFYLNYAGAPWLAEMVAKNRDVARQLGYANVPALKKAVAQNISAFVERAGFSSPCAPPRKRSTWRWRRPTWTSRHHMPMAPRSRPARAPSSTGAGRSPSRTPRSS